MPDQQIIEVLPRSGNQYKVNLHTHSTCSDGKFTPEQLKEYYMSLGYDAVAFTDHRKCIPHTELTDDKFVALTGLELDFNSNDEQGRQIKVVHMNALAGDPEKTGEFPSMPLDYDLINETVAKLKAEGYYVTLNHPVWSNMCSGDIAAIQGFDAMEICNSIALMFNNFSDDSALYEYYLRAGGKATPIAADDCHRKYPDGTPFAEYGKSFIMVKAEELTYDAIFQAIKAGACYASTGPKFENIWLEGDTLHVQCSPVFGVYVHSMYLNKKAQLVEKADTITHATFDISHIRQASPYFWVQIRSANGEKAWATPYWFEKQD